MIRYFLYSRKSAEEEERQVLSNEAQIHELKKIFRVKQGLRIKEMFVESRSAKTPGRPVFGEMIARLEKGDAQGIISWHPDRLARNSVDGGRIIYLLDQGLIKDLPLEEQG